MPFESQIAKEISPIAFKQRQLIPSKVELKHINPNGRLLTDEQIIEVKKAFEENSGRSRLRLDKMPFTTMHLKGKYYAVYKGGSRQLGKGSFGKVKIMQDLGSGEWCALKVIDPKRIHVNGFTNFVSISESFDEKLFMHELSEEIHNLNKLSSYKGSLLRYKSSFKSKQAYPDKAFIGMNLAKGVPLDKLDISHLEPSQILQIFENILIAIKDFHDDGLLHLDITNRNILYDLTTNTATLVDVGFAIPAPEKGKSYISSTLVGTPLYMAPEIVNAKKQEAIQNKCIYSEKSEIYAAGTTLIMLLWGNDKHTIFAEEHPALFNYILDFAKKKSTPEERPTFEEAIEFINIYRQAYRQKKISSPSTGPKDIVKGFDFIQTDKITNENEEISPETIRRLQSMDEVWTLTSSGPDQKVCQAIQDLEKQGIKIKGSLKAKYKDIKDIGFIRVDEIVNKNGKIPSKTIQQLRKLDEVWVLTNSELNPKAHQAIRNLKKQGINISGILEPKKANCTEQQFNSAEVLVQAREYIEQSFPGSINTYYLTNCNNFSDKKDLYKNNFQLTGETNPDMPVTNKHLYIIIVSLQKEKKRMESRLDDDLYFFKDVKAIKTRCGFIQGVLDFLEKTPNAELTYRMIRDELQKLENSIKPLHANKIRYLFSFFNNKTIHGAKVIADIRSNVCGDDIENSSRPSPAA